MRNLRCFMSTIMLSIFLFPPFMVQSQNIAPEVLAASEAIDYDYFFKHLQYLSSDELEGRGIGTEGYRKAANYVAGEFKKSGLVPFGDSGTYLQQVPLLKTTIKAGSFNLRIEKKSEFFTTDYGSQISVVLSPKEAIVDEQQEMVFVGYGNIIAEKNINDYEGVDVTGKTVIVALGGPKGIEHPAFNDRNAKFENAIANGADGLLLFYPKANLFQKIIFKKVHGFLSTEMLALADTRIKSSIGNDELKLLLFAQKGFVRKIFKLNGLRLKSALRKIAKGKLASRALSSEINCSYELKNDSLESHNVVALLPGTDARLKEEYVVIGGHLDHFGIGKPMKGDSIYNGMLDNASGVSGILTISKTFAELAERTKRSVIFVCYTAEENGLLGSSYFANSHKVTAGKIVAKINIDMLAQTIETEDMAPLGYSHSNLSEATDAAARALNLKIDDNRQAEVSYMERSDQISFIKKGIPALFIAAGFTAVDPKKDGKKVFDKWMKKTYHTPFDELDQDYSDQAFLTAIKFNFLTTYYIANTLDVIQWDKSSWLFKKYVLERY